MSAGVMTLADVFHVEICLERLLLAEVLTSSNTA